MASIFDDQGTTPDPVALFARWREEAKDRAPLAADAMVLATADASGRPSARAVILRTVDPAGFVFYTDIESRKARQLAANPLAALVFVWPELGRQARVEGEVGLLAEDEADRWFADRPREFRLAVWASHQDEPVAGRDELEKRMGEAAGRFPGDVPRPPWWGGYRLVPSVVEFWEAREGLLHDRLEFRRADGGVWAGRRLSP